MDKKNLKILFADDPEILAKIEAMEIESIRKMVEAFPIPKDGKTPEKGKDYWTQEELSEIKEEIKEGLLEEVTPIKGVHYFDGDKGEKGDKGDRGEPGLPGIGLNGRDGKDGSPDSPEDIAEKLNTLKDAVDVSVIKGAVAKADLEDQSKKVLSGMAEIDGRVKAIDQRWRGAGLSKVIHDTTLSGSGTSNDPLSVANATTTWGQITGTLSNQTDLKNALDAKLNTSALSISANQVAYGNGTNTLTGSGNFTYDGSVVTITNGTTYTVGDVISPSMFQDESAGGNLYAYGNYYSFDIYAYRIISGNKFYSAIPANLVQNDNGDGMPFKWNISWPAVTGADGYKLVVINDGWNGFTNYEVDMGNVFSYAYDGSGATPSAVFTPSSPYTVYSNGLNVQANETVSGNLTVSKDATVGGTLDVSTAINLTGPQTINTGTNQVTGLNITGIGSGGDTLYDPIRVFSGSTGSKLFAVGDDGSGYNGTVYMLGNSAHTPQIGELSWLDQAIAAVDQRIISYQGYKDGATGAYYFSVSPLSLAGTFGPTYGAFVVSGAQNGSAGVFGGTGRLPKSKLDVAGGTSIGASYAGITAAPTNGLIVQGTAGFGTNAPNSTTGVHIINTTEPLRAGYSSSQYWTAVTSSAGVTTFDAVGTSAGFVINDGTTFNANVGIGNAPSGTYNLDVNGINSAHFHASGQGDLVIAHSGLVSYVKAAGGIGLSLGANGGGQIFINTSGNVGINTTSQNSNLHVNGSFATAYVQKTGAYTLTATDNVVECTSGTFALTLPTAVGITGRQYTMINSGTGVISINTTLSQTVSGNASGALTLVQNDSITVVSNNANWLII